MIPKIIMHNAMSLNGYITGFEPDLETYYKIAGTYDTDAVLVGSNTAKKGFDMFLEKIPTEAESDFKKPNLKDNPSPYWIVPDSRGVLINMLHVLRQTDYCKDVILFVSKKTPQKYLKYLEERNYDYIIAGEDHVDYKEAFEIINKKYNIKTMRSDSGPTLNTILLKQGLIDKISILISPTIAETGNTPLFTDLDDIAKLELIRKEVFDKNQILLVYKPVK